MPISISEFATPSFTRLQERYPMSYDKEDRFNEVFPLNHAGRYPGDQGREGGWKLPGYNPHHNSTRTERIRLRSDDITIKPY